MCQQFVLQFDSLIKIFKDTFRLLIEDSQSPIYKHELNLDQDRVYFIDSSNNFKTHNNCLRYAFNVLHNIVQHCLF